MFLTKKQYWTLSLSWGIILTALGFLVAQILKLFGCKMYENLYGYYFIIGDNWGGFSLGPYSIVSKNPSDHVLHHEFGHSVQNCFFGPLMPFIVSIPSAIRYWKREIELRSGKKSQEELPPYDSIWFEGMATYLGDQYALMEEK